MVSLTVARWPLASRSPGAVVDTLPALIAASAASGFAGALFNPAVRAYLAADAGERRVEAFALFNVFYQAGILLGPLVGLALTWVDFRLTCLVAAGVFAVLTAAQVRALPQRTTSTGPQSDGSPAPGWRQILSNRSFLLFAGGDDRLVRAVVPGVPGAAAGGPPAGMATARSPRWVWARCSPRPGCSPSPRRPGSRLVPPPAEPPGGGRAGPGGDGRRFLPLLAAVALPVPSGAGARAVLAVLPAVLSAALLATGTMIAYPFELDLIVTLSGDPLVATHYGLYNTICGIGITAGNSHRSGAGRRPPRGAAGSALAGARRARGAGRRRAARAAARRSPLRTRARPAGNGLNRPGVQARRGRELTHFRVAEGRPGVGAAAAAERSPTWTRR